MLPYRLRGFSEEDSEGARHEGTVLMSSLRTRIMFRSNRLNAEFTDEEFGDEEGSEGKVSTRPTDEGCELLKINSIAKSNESSYFCFRKIFR